MTEKPMNRWGEKIKELRIKAGKHTSRRALARAVKVKETTFGGWCTDEKNGGVPTDALVRLSAVLGVSIFEILPEGTKYSPTQLELERAVELARGAAKKQPVDKSVILAIDRVMTAMHAALAEFDEAKKAAEWVSDDKIK